MGITTKHKLAIFAFLLCGGLAIAAAVLEPWEQWLPDPKQAVESVQPEAVIPSVPEKPAEPEEPEVPEDPPVTLETIRTAVFADISPEEPVYDTACYMGYYGILTADENGTFHRYAPLTRGELAAALYAMGGAPEVKSDPFVDTQVDSPSALGAVWCHEYSILPADEAGLFHPEERVTRGELAGAMYRAAEVWEYPNMKGWREDHPADHPISKGQLWVMDNGLYRTFTEDESQGAVAISRLQAAQALMGLRALSGEDALAADIYAALPDYEVQSAARSNHDAIQAAVEAAAAKYKARGVQVAVVENGVVTDTYATGWATINADPMTAEHKMRVASISKVAVGMTAMLLREQGIINLDDSIGPYWGLEVKHPTYPNDPITFRTLLTHTSSIINAGDDESRAYANVYNRLQNGYFSRAVPGDIGYWSYNNYAFGVLGMTLELASGRLVDDILEESLYSAMDIDASFAPGDLRDTDRLATLYRSSGEVARSVEAQQNMHNDPTPGATGKFFAGGLTVSVADLGKLVALLAGDGRYEGVQLLQEESVELMETCNKQAVPGGSYQALPMRYFPALYGTSGVYFHTGSAYGVYNCATYDPETGNGVVVLTTGAYGDRDDYGIYKVCAEINEFIYGMV